MTHRQRVLKTLRFEPTDRPPCDLMEATVWPELMDYFTAERGIADNEALYDHLDVDFRWLRMVNPNADPNATGAPAKPRTSEKEFQSRQVTTGPLVDAQTIADVEAHRYPNLAALDPPDCAEARQRFPDHALVLCPGWNPLFWGACDAFGMDVAMVHMHERPELIDAFVQRQHAAVMDLLPRVARAGEGLCDAVHLGDDFAHQQGMMLSPDMWRRFIKPCLAQEVRAIRDHGLACIYHSCGAVRPVLGDFIDIGISVHLVFQTTARGMDPESIARDFGGRIAFYGGMDVQHVLSYASVEEVAAEVRRNARAFADRGGYIVANSHHCVDTISGRNVEAMCRAVTAGSGS